MADITGNAAKSEQGYEFIEWLLITDSDTALEMILSRVSEMSSAILTVWGVMTTATVGLEGSFDGTTWFALRDAAGAVIAITDSDDPATVEVPFLYKHIRPVTPGGAVTQSINVALRVR